MVVFTTCHYFFGLHFFYSQIFSFSNNEAETNLTSYGYNREGFINEYDRANPVTSIKATREYMDYMKSKTKFYFFEEKRPKVADHLAGFISKISNNLNSTDSNSGTGMKEGGLANYAKTHELSRFNR